MEYALWLPYLNHFKDGKPSLNPCSNGICSLIWQKRLYQRVYYRLNPCSNGICSLMIAEIFQDNFADKS